MQLVYGVKRTTVEICVMVNFTRLTDLNSVTCSPDSPTYEVLQRLNESDHLFFIVVNSEGKPLGTITDGDIRRAILDGATLDDPSSRCMFHQSRFGQIGNDSENYKALQGVPFLPLVDASGNLAEVLIPNGNLPRLKTAMIMAGGKGVRLGKRTRNTPKPLLSVGDQPILEHIIGNLEDAGVESIFVSVHYLADQISAFLKKRHSRAKFKVIEESEMLGTAGALSLLPSEISHPILVINGDLVTKTNFLALNYFHWRHTYDASIAVTQHETEVPFGVVQKDKNGLFLAIEEKPIIRNFVAAGIYYLSPEFFALVPKNTPFDMPDLLNRGREIGLKVGLFPIHEPWIDVGRPDDLKRADDSYNPKIVK